MRAMKVCSYMATGIPKDVIDLIRSITVNSSAESLSDYLEVRGGSSGLVTQERYQLLAQFVSAFDEARESGTL
jgi:hypothetical protein